jgi:hypothetical protein
MNAVMRIRWSIAVATVMIVARSIWLTSALPQSQGQAQPQAQGNDTQPLYSNLEAFSQDLKNLLGSLFAGQNNFLPITKQIHVIVIVYHSERSNYQAKSIANKIIRAFYVFLLVSITTTAFRIACLCD